MLPTPSRILFVAEAFRQKFTLKKIYNLTKIDPWFLAQIEDLVKEEIIFSKKQIKNLSHSEVLKLKKKGFSDSFLSRILDCSFGAAKKLGFVTDGTAPVKIEVVEWGDGEYMHHD